MSLHWKEDSGLKALAGEEKEDNKLKRVDGFTTGVCVCVCEWVCVCVCVCVVCAVLAWRGWPIDHRCFSYGGTHQSMIVLIDHARFVISLLRDCPLFVCPDDLKVSTDFSLVTITG